MHAKMWEISKRSHYYLYIAQYDIHKASEEFLFPTQRIKTSTKTATSGTGERLKTRATNIKYQILDCHRTKHFQF